MCRELQNYLQIYTCTITVIHMLLVDISGQTQDFKFYEFWFKLCIFMSLNWSC